MDYAIINLYSTIMTIKHTQLTRVGYEYQDLICIKILIDWFHDPKKYQWVCIECTADQGEFKSLDDVVVLNKKGLYELYQVKFTIDPNRDDLNLSFEWLLDKKPNGTSLLQKWEKDVKKYNENSLLSIAELKTNRVPNDELLQCLNNDKINVVLIPDYQLEKIVKQLGDLQSAKDFFEIFTFNHSQPEIDNLENQLKDSLIPDHCVTEESWFRFKNSVKRWATRKNQPNPDGKITIDHVSNLLRDTPSHSIPQYFDVPNGYTPPSQEFHESVLQKINSLGSFVVSGLPGMGKSTYLSYLTDVLKQKSYVIRHHYALSSQQGLHDRITFPNVARSLQHQLKQQFPSLFDGRDYRLDELFELIKRASAQALQEDQKLIIIIDGLDHVARERSDISQLEHLVNDTHLPSSLISHVPREKCWFSLPSMDLYAIERWMTALSRTNQIKLLRDNSDNEIINISEALLKISNGYPLHILYSVKSLTKREKTLNAFDIEKLPICSEGNIHNYYTTLWSNLSAGAKQILLLISCVEFPWPDSNSIASCYKDSLSFENEFSDIQHLIEKRRSGVFPFHGSLLVFLRNTQEYTESHRRLLERVKQWLKTCAPEYWRWGWEWIIKADLGNVDPLITGITRNWSLNAFCKGYPLQHIEHIIAVAEKAALDNERFDELVGLRLIKIRLINAPEHQIQEYCSFLKCAYNCNPDSYGLIWRSDNIKLLDDKELFTIALLYKNKNISIQKDCFKEALRRLDFYIQFGDESHYQKIKDLIDIIIDILTNASSPDINQIIHFIERFENNQNIFLELFNRLIETENSHLILDIPSTKIPQDLQNIFWHYYILASCYEEIDLANNNNPNEICSNPLGNCFIFRKSRYINRCFISITFFRQY